MKRAQMPAGWPLILMFLKRDVVRRRLPHGLLGPVYLWPGDDSRAHLHRRFWWQGKPRRSPRPLWLAIELWLWLRWVFWHAIPACRRTIRRLGPTVEAEEGIPIRTQMRHILKLALLWCIPPGESYRFRLYRHPGQALDYVYDSECAAFHAWRSAPLGITCASLDLIQDKARLARELNRLGIPVATTLAHIAKGDWAFPFAHFVKAHGRVFCKMNGGNRGRRAFTTWATPECLAGRTFIGQDMPDTGAVDAAWRQLLELDAVLIQTYLENHPVLAPLAWNDDAITVRFISQWQDATPGAPPTRLTCLSATLEVPAGVSPKGRTYYAILPIQAESGELGAPLDALTAEPSVRAAVKHVATAAGTIAVLPDWGRLIEASYRAHRLFPDVRAIAWDWVITPGGPRLLEGNTGWGALTPQQCLEKGFATW